MARLRSTSEKGALALMPARSLNEVEAIARRIRQVRHVAKIGATNDRTIKLCTGVYRTFNRSVEVVDDEVEMHGCPMSSVVAIDRAFWTPWSSEKDALVPERHRRPPIIFLDQPQSQAVTV